MSNESSPVGKLIEQSRVLFVLAVLLGNSNDGSPLSWILKIVAKYSESYKECLNSISKEVGKKGTFSPAVARYGKFFLPFVPALISVGEEMGDLECPLLNASELVKRIAELESSGVVVDQNELATAIDFLMFAMLVDAGLPVRRSLKIMSEISSLLNRSAFTAISESVDGGSILCVAVKQHGQSIKIPKNGGSLSDQYIVDIIAHGEAESVVAHALKYLARLAMDDALRFETDTLHLKFTAEQEGSSD